MAQDKVRLASVGLGRWARVLARGAQRGDRSSSTAASAATRPSATAFQEEYGVAARRVLLRGAARRPRGRGRHRHDAERHAQGRDHPGAARPARPSTPTSRSRTRSRTPTGSPPRSPTTGQVFAVGHSSRRLSGHREMKRWIDDGRIGEISPGRGQLLQRARARAHPADLALVRRQEPGRRLHPARRAPRRHAAVPARPGEERHRARAQALHEVRGARRDHGDPRVRERRRSATSAPAGPRPASTR